MNNCSFSKKDIQDLAQLKLGLKHLETLAEDVKYRVDLLEDDYGYAMEAFKKNNADIERLTKSFEKLQDSFSHSRFSYLFKNHYWKITGFILSTATILGAIGEYLYRLPSPH